MALGKNAIGNLLGTVNANGALLVALDGGTASATTMTVDTLKLSIANPDVIANREGANWWFQRNSTNAQRWSLANTYTSSTNYEAFSIDAQTAPNVWIVGSRTAATGTNRRTMFGAQESNAADSYTFAVFRSPTNATMFQLGAYTASLGAVSSAAAGNKFTMSEYTSTATSGTVASFAVIPTYNQSSGTAANTDLLIQRTETAIGSGTQRLIDAQVGSTTKFNVHRTGVVGQAGVAFTSLPTGVAGMVAYITDSNTATWGATIAGSGANKVLGFFNGTNWTVAGV